MKNINKSNNTEPKVMLFEDIRDGDSQSFRYKIDHAVYSHFIDAFQDLNPLHTDVQYAKEQGFPGTVMHGAILNGFVSHFVGMVFPGRNSILHSVDLRYLKPSFEGDEIEVVFNVSQRVESTKTVVFICKLFNITRDYLVARGRVQVGLLQ